jgi:hypothetical protein
MINEDLKDLLMVQSMMQAENFPEIRLTPPGDLPEGVAENFAVISAYAITQTNPDLLAGLSATDFFETFEAAVEETVKEIHQGNFVD